MLKKVYLFCGVESTGKSYAIENAYNYLKEKGYKVKIVSEVGREVCATSGGVFSMSLLDYEQILYLHQATFLKHYKNEKYDIILLDTDSTYTRYYLEKDEKLTKENPQICKDLINLSKDIALMNNKNNRINEIIYLNSDCPFIQDGTRTYESTRKQDDKTLFNLYQNMYYPNKQIKVIKGDSFEDRTKQILSHITNTL